jgi:hypothetical protein
MRNQEYYLGVAARACAAADVGAVAWRHTRGTHMCEVKLITTTTDDDGALAVAYSLSRTPCCRNRRGVRLALSHRPRARTPVGWQARRDDAKVIL